LFELACLGRYALDLRRQHRQKVALEASESRGISSSERPCQVQIFDV
jgi:hypothetical protein